jgi:hypothetical protein
MALGLHYLPLNLHAFWVDPAWSGICVNQPGGRAFGRTTASHRWVEPVIMLVIFWLLAWLVGG